MPRPIIVILFSIALALASRAEDWPQWRGSGRDGVWHEKGIRKTFPAEGLPVRWRAPVGYGFSSPVVAKGRVFVTDALSRPPQGPRPRSWLWGNNGKMALDFLAGNQ